ncbi:MAG: hypothetical protein ACPKQO_04800 [Nitrososphaeraceae archaeon]
MVEPFISSEIATGIFVMGILSFIATSISIYVTHKRAKQENEVRLFI